MDNDTQRLEKDRQAILDAQQQGRGATVKTYTRLSGPGWLQGAITLGGGSLSGALYLGILGGFSLLWLQPIAMILGIVMLSAISYVTLSTGERPFHLINRRINPVLGWGWAIATMMANIVWCLPQFALGSAAIQQNLLPSVGSGLGPSMAIGAVLLAFAVVIIWLYDSGSRGVRIFEIILKVMVGIVVVSFIGVVIKLALTPEGIQFGKVFSGYIPNLGLLFSPADTFEPALAAAGEFRSFWENRIVSMQRDVMVTATATAVGINMTFLLPYSMLKKGWDRDFRGLAIFDLSIGLFLPYLLATSCVMIAAASQFHTVEQPGLVDGTAENTQLISGFNGELTGRVKVEVGPEGWATLNPKAKDLSEEQIATRQAALDERIAALPEQDKRLAAMLIKRDAFVLADALKPLAGAGVSQYVFGIGILGMALSTIIILMLINGFTVCEMLNRPAKGNLHRFGCLIPAVVGFFAPILWHGEVQTWLAIPTSVFGMALLPIAYLSFFLLMNHKKLLGESALVGVKKILFNLAMGLALVLSGFGAGWSIWSKTKWYGVGLVAVLISLTVFVHMKRKSDGEPENTAG